jgi:Zn-dependent protease
MELSLAAIVLWAVPVVLAITLHEAAHGFVARQFGDQTAYMLGRVTLNPLKHIDPIGTIVVPGFLIAVSVLTRAPLFIFGWAKPVPVNFGNLRHPKRDMFWVAGAGPFANFAMAVAWALLLKFTSPAASLADAALGEMAIAGIDINVLLMILNVLPIPPLDGGRMALSLLPQSAAAVYARLERYGFALIILLMIVLMKTDLPVTVLDFGRDAIGRLVGIA